ncbi:hypothetical protein BREVNS_1507 [Brevinematales bacterium NS]|nr:hypothetical protein BREVNS_1507 [Brevinematales bacterium NS]
MPLKPRFFRSRGLICFFIQKESIFIIVRNIFILFLLFYHFF